MTVASVANGLKAASRLDLNESLDETSSSASLATPSLSNEDSQQSQIYYDNKQHIESQQSTNPVKDNKKLIRNQRQHDNHPLSSAAIIEKINAYNRLSKEDDLKHRFRQFKPPEKQESELDRVFKVSKTISLLYFFTLSN